MPNGRSLFLQHPRLIGLLMLGLMLAPRGAHAQLSESQIVPADVMDGDLFGDSITIDGNRIVVGVRLADINNVVNTGAAYVFERRDGQWHEVQKLTAPDRSPQDFFGESVALEGDWLFIGAMGNDDREPEGGAVYVFKRNDGQWEQVQILYPNDPQDFHRFGWEIALEGDRVFVSAPQDEELDIQAGAVYVFERDPLSDEWGQTQKILPENNIPGLVSFFGTTMGLDGEHLIVGAPTDDGAADAGGAAYMFRFNRGQWEQTDKLLPPPVVLPDSLENDTFGREVALHGDWAFASSFDDEVCINKPLFDPDNPNSCVSGAVFAFQRQGNGDWKFQQKIAPEELDQFDYFGTNAIVVEGNYAVIGSRGDDDACPNPPPPKPLFCDTGAAYLFELIGDAWVKADKFTASDADSLDFLGGAIFSQGRPLGISGSHIVAGAPTVPLGQNPAPRIGAAYIFKFMNQDPVAADDDAMTNAGDPVTIDVLANDTDADADALSVSIAGQPANGTATANANGTITYTSNAGFSGTDTFTYALDDGDGGTVEAAVTITVTRSNAAPTVTQSIDDINLILGGDTFTSDLSTVFADPEGDALTFSASSSDDGVATATISGQTLTVEALSLGSATITATADDGNGGATSTTFGVSIETAVSVEAGEAPTTFELSSNYPNPFNPATQIRFGLPQAAAVRLAVFDVLGREVAVLVEGRLPAGWHEATFEAADLPSGVYLYQLDAEGQMLSRTMLLMK